MTTSESQSNNDSQMLSNSLHHDAKDELPDTGDSDSNSTGLVSAVAAMLAGLGLFGKSRKNKKIKRIKDQNNKLLHVGDRFIK